MNALQLPFLVEGALILIAMLFGWWTSKQSKPYKLARLITHLFFFVWFTTGFGFILWSLTQVPTSPLTWGLAAAMGIAIAAQLVTGILMLLAKKGVGKLPFIHLYSAAAMFLASVGAVFSTAS